MSLIGVCRPCRQHLIRNFAIRSLSTEVTSTNQNDAATRPPPPEASFNLDPNKVATRRGERKLIKAGIAPIGSRRRRAALQTSRNIPFEELPYQCFQEARKFLQEDRAEKIAHIEKERARIQRVQEQQPTNEASARQKEVRLGSMRRHLEWLKIQADINDPLVKKRFEDGQGDMNRPIYRYLSERKWSERKKLIIEQRITQMHVVPDVIPPFSITADVDLYYPGAKNLESKSIVPRPSRMNRVAVPPGEFVASTISEIPPRLNVQVFDKGERLVTVAIIDPDVPDLERDSFDSRCNFLAVNVPISPTSCQIPLDRLDAASQVVYPWAVPYAHKGAPYHRQAVLIFRQPDGVTIDIKEASKKATREGFSMRGFTNRYALQPFGAHLFRTQWDEWMEGVMLRAGIEGANIEFKPRRTEPLPYKKKDPKRFR